MTKTADGQHQECGCMSYRTSGTTRNSGNYFICYASLTPRFLWRGSLLEETEFLRGPGLVWCVWGLGGCVCVGGGWRCVWGVVVRVWRVWGGGV